MVKVIQSGFLLIRTYQMLLNTRTDAIMQLTINRFSATFPRQDFSRGTSSTFRQKARTFPPFPDK